MSAAELYVGETTHQRFSPPHKFRYRLFELLVDVDAIETEPLHLRLLRRGRFGLMSFDRRDHGPRDGSALRPWVEARLAESGVAATATRIRLFCFPRVLGFVFNPLSIFFAYDAEERLEAVIYEVSNTFGQSHAYVAPATGARFERHSVQKALYVSPFFEVEGGYRFRIAAPGERFELTILKQVNGRADFCAVWTAQRRPLTDAALAGLFLGMPLMTLGVVFAIHWQALRLWLKGARFHIRAPGPRMAASRARMTTDRTKITQMTPVVPVAERERAR